MIERALLDKFIKKYQGENDYLALRYVDERTTTFSVRNQQLDSQNIHGDRGVMIEILHDGHFGYSATCHLSEEGLQNAYEKARQDTRLSSSNKAFHFSAQIRPKATGHFQSPFQKPLRSLPLRDLTETLTKATRRLKVSDQIVTAVSDAMLVETEFLYLASQGSEISQKFDMVMIDASATAQKGTDFQTRSLNGGLARSYQMGAEAFQTSDLFHDCERVGEEAMKLVEAPNCPTGKMDVLIAPDQMMLQIHESIGHPLELDRILGDERNFAGWSFVKLSDIGQLQYGSAAMNVTFDPHISGQLASYAFDDGAQPTTKEFLIKDGVLIRGLGSAESQVRSQKPGVANFRAASWNRAPIDRMANINLEKGSSSLADMIAATEKGILLRSNRSWSIDDYRNKFQFGCEFGQLIEDGRLTNIVKNPNYRGTTLNFWRNLKLVGQDSETFGTPYCGKGEPSQIIRVGHASPSCLFKDIDVFGGQA